MFVYELCEYIKGDTASYTVSMHAPSICNLQENESLVTVYKYLQGTCCKVRVKWTDI